MCSAVQVWQAMVHWSVAKLMFDEYADDTRDPPVITKATLERALEECEADENVVPKLLANLFRAADGLG